MGEEEIQTETVEPKDCCRNLLVSDEGVFRVGLNMPGPGYGT